MSTKLFEASSEEITKLQELIYQKMTPFKCPLCKTYFEKELFLTAHTKKCKKANSKYYCKLCDIAFTKIMNYNNHKLSKEHSDNVKSIEVEAFEMPSDNIDTMTKADPFLDEDDKKELTNNIGSGFSVSYKDGTYQTYKFKEVNNDDVNDVVNNDVNNVVNNFVNNVVNNSQKSVNNNVVLEERYNTEVKQREKLVDDNITPNQQKLLEFLLKIEGQSDATHKFFNALNLLSLEDYKDLNVVIIRFNDIGVSSRQDYIQVLRKFKTKLVEMINNGTSIYRNMKIETLLQNLTL